MSNIDSISSSIELINSIQSVIGDEYSRLFDLARSVQKMRKEHLAHMPYHINIIDELYINENAHSRILAKLLQFQDEKDNYVFLESFIDLIKQKKGSPEFDAINVKSPIITQETERIDLWIRDWEAHYAIIIENKIYGAYDQESQLFRYIKKTRACKFSDKDIFIIYLTKYRSEPNKQTWGNEKTRNDFSGRYMALSFKDDVLCWLKDFIYPNIRLKDSYLQGAVSQYIDYLEGLFSIREINKSLNMNVQKVISNKLQLDSLSEKDALLKIEETIEDLDKTRDALEQMLPIVKRKLWNILLPDLNSIVNRVAVNHKLIGSVGFFDETSYFFIDFSKNKWELHLVFEKYDDDSFFVYIGQRGEETIEKECTDTILFRRRSERDSHPYGWEYIDQYNGNWELLMQDIKNGSFEEFLSDEVEQILEEIKENEIIM